VISYMAFRAEMVALGVAWSLVFILPPTHMQILKERKNLWECTCFSLSATVFRCLSLHLGPDLDSSGKFAPFQRTSLSSQVLRLYLNVRMKFRHLAIRWCNVPNEFRLQLRPLSKCSYRECSGFRWALRRC
jgi:hypothetical protein